MNRYALSLLLTMSCLATVAQADELGRLFFTPQQRQLLGSQQSGSSNAASGHRNFIIVNGVVQKHGGNRTVWINGAAQAAEEGHDRNPTVERVTVPGKQQPVQLKVGQKLPLEAPAADAEEEEK